MGLKVFRSKIFPKIDELGQCINMYFFLLVQICTVVHIEHSLLLQLSVEFWPVCHLGMRAIKSVVFTYNSESDWEPGEFSSTNFVVTDKQGRQLVIHE